MVGSLRFCLGRFKRAIGKYLGIPEATDGSGSVWAHSSSVPESLQVLGTQSFRFGVVRWGKQGEYASTTREVVNVTLLDVPFFTERWAVSQG